MTVSRRMHATSHRVCGTSCGSIAVRPGTAHTSGSPGIGFGSGVCCFSNSGKMSGLLLGCGVIHSCAQCMMASTLSSEVGHVADCRHPDPDAQQEPTAGGGEGGGCTPPSG